MLNRAGQQLGNYRISRRTLLLGFAGLVTTAAAGSGITWVAHLSHPVEATTKPSTPTPTLTPTPIPVGTLLRPYYGHFGYVYTVAWLPAPQAGSLPGGKVMPDHTNIASGSDDHTVHIWDADTGSDIIPTYSNHADGVHSLAWSPDGSLIASGSADKTAQVWKSADGNPVFIYNNHTGAVNAVAWSPDGTRIASASADNTVRIWKAADGSDVFTYSGHTDIVNTVAWSPDGTRIASGSNDKTAQVWQAT